MALKGRNPTQDEKKHMDRVMQLGCIICHNEDLHNTEVEIHHIDGKTKQDCHFKVLPLCFRHHREGSYNDSWVSRHPFKKGFQARYGKEEDLLDQVNAMLENKQEKI